MPLSDATLTPYKLGDEVRPFNGRTRATGLVALLFGMLMALVTDAVMLARFSGASRSPRCWDDSPLRPLWPWRGWPRLPPPPLGRPRPRLVRGLPSPDRELRALDAPLEASVRASDPSPCLCPRLRAGA